ncbi:MAG: hypothetical protein R2788_16125 [Saprospiraceae bacterium]
MLFVFGVACNNDDPEIIDSSVPTGQFTVANSGTFSLRKTGHPQRMPDGVGTRTGKISFALGAISQPN